MSKAPKLRFKEFGGDWESKRLGEFGEFLKGAIISKSDLTECGTPCILYGELYTRYKEVINKTISRTNLKSSNLVFSKKNDILIPASGETALDMSTASCLQEDNVILGGDLNIFRSSKLNGIFISYQLNSSKKKEIAKLAQGASVVHIYSNQLKNLKIDITSLKEQEKIASFLSLVDEKINLQDKKLENLKNYKKGIMSKIFNRELRFKDDNGNDYPNWEEKKLEEICILKKGEQLNRDTLIEEGEYYVLNGGIEPSGYTNKYNTNENTISISEGGNSCGYVNYNFKRFWSGGHCYTLENILNKINVKYLYQYLKYKQQNIMNLRVGTGLPNIQKKDLIIFKIKVPCLDEQIKISSFLSLIDEKIEKEAKKLELLNDYKKGLLQQMFV